MQASDFIRSAQIIASIENASAGPTYSVVRLAQSLADMGDSSCVFSLDTSPSVSTEAGVEYHRFPADTSSILGRMGLLPSSAMEAGIDAAARSGTILHMHGIWRMPNIYPARLARRRRVPFIASPRGMFAKEALRYSRFGKQLFWHAAQKRALEAVSCFHATAEPEMHEVRELGFSAPVAIIPNGIDVEELAPAPASGGERRQILYLGRLHPQKGIDRLLHAWSRLEATHPDWELMIVGPSDGDHVEELRQLASGLMLQSVGFSGAVRGVEKSVLYRQAELVVLPTLRENFGMVVAEALAQGTPVISTVGAPWQGLAEHGCGWWIEHGPEPLAVALAQAMKMSDEQREAMGQRGRAWMTRDFAWKGIAEKMSRLYRWCQDGGEIPEFVHVSK